MSAQRNSKQRTAILNELRSRYDHPTAEQLYCDLKAQVPTLSLATVYRNLKQLEESGDIMRLFCGDANYFDGNAKNHYHLTCKVCGSVIDLEIKDSGLINRLPSPFGGRVISHSLMFFGLCKACAENSAN